MESTAAESQKGDRDVILNGECSTSLHEKEEINKPAQPQKLCSANKFTDLNGLTIHTQSRPSTSTNENHLTSGHSDLLEYDPSTSEEKNPTEQAELEDPCEKSTNLTYVSYESELQMEAIMALITKDLSEPYSIYTYRYFIHNWPNLCFLAMDGDNCVGAIVCKLDMHKNMVRRGYIAMLAVEKEYRRQKIGSNLVVRAIKAMQEDSCDEVVLETEVTNTAALRLYENLGFVRDKRLFRYYLNGVDALRLKLWLR